MTFLLLFQLIRHPLEPRTAKLRLPDEDGDAVLAGGRGHPTELADHLAISLPGRPGP